MNSLLNQRFHVGAYGILIDNGKILLIKKSKGAYKGLYDLPGGGIEFGETIEEALKRELMEETGVLVNNFSFVDYNEYFCEYKNDTGEDRSLHHIAFFFKIEGDVGKIKDYPDGKDSLGAELVDIASLSEDNISPIAWPVVERFILGDKE